MAKIKSLFVGVFSVAVAVFLGGVNCQGSKHPEQALLEKMFDGGRYDSRVRPLNGGNTSEPVMVSVNFFLRRVNKVDDINNEFDIQLTYRQRWRDERLSFSTGGSTKVQQVSLLNPQNKVWRPDTFFSNEKQGNYHELMTRNEFVRIFPNGDILHSSLLSMRLFCPMNLRKFPFDTQTCYMRLASYGYKISDVKYEWQKNNPVEVSKNLMMYKFTLEGMVTSYCDSITSTGSYSCLRVEFTLRRNSSPYLIHVFIPCIMLVLVSMVSFWINIQAITARIIVNIASLFVLAMQTAEVNRTFPTTSYTKAVDSYTGICLTFCFAALLETATVHYLTRRKERGLSKVCQNSNDSPDAESGPAEHVNEEHEIPLKDLGEGEEAEKEKKDSAKTSKKGRMLEIIQRLRDSGMKYMIMMETHHKNLDLISRVVFPALFLIFNILYWIIVSV